mgnify:CR=1 FL=1
MPWIHTGKPSETESPLYFLEGPKELAQLALAPTPAKASDVVPVEGLRLAVVPLRLTQRPVQGDLHQSIWLPPDTTALAYGFLTYLMGGCTVGLKGCSKEHQRAVMLTATSSASARSVGHTKTRSYFKMKRTLTALTLAASLIASGASAFEMNTTQTDESRLMGTPIVGDLTVGVPAIITVFSNTSCTIDGKLHLRSTSPIVTEQSSYSIYYKVQLQADGEFIMTFDSTTDNGNKRIPPLGQQKCDELMYSAPDETFIPVKSMNGFTDRRSFVIDLINQGYD